MANKVKLLTAAAVIAGGLSLSAPASAGTGCNGVINIFLWGCAPWDNNWGAQHHYYKKKKKPVAAGTPVKMENGIAYALVNGQWLPMVAAGGGNVVPTNAGNFISTNGGNVWVSQ